MWEKIRKSVLCIAVISAVITIAVLVETGKFESPAGLFLVLVNIGYLALFTVANCRRENEC